LENRLAQLGPSPAHLVLEDHCDGTELGGMQPLGRGVLMQETFKVASYDVTWLCGPLCGMRLPAAAIYFCFCFSIFSPTVSTVPGSSVQNLRKRI